MTLSMKIKIVGAAVLTAALLTAAPAFAEMSAEDLAKLTQNPVGNLISVPFQNNTNFSVGPEERRQIRFQVQFLFPK